jgi:hypothetical protein
MQIPTGVIGIITLLSGIYLTNRFKMRWPILAFLCLPCIAGATGLIHVSRSNLHGLMATYYITWFLAGIRESLVSAGSRGEVSHKGIEPLLFAWANLNAAGTTKRVVTTASMFGGSCIGNVSFLRPSVACHLTYHTRSLVRSCTFRGKRPLITLVSIAISRPGRCSAFSASPWGSTYGTSTTSKPNAVWL